MTINRRIRIWALALLLATGTVAEYQHSVSAQHQLRCTIPSSLETRCR